MTTQQARKLLDEPKWWEYIPVIGTMIYSVRFEMKLVDATPQVRKGIKFYRTWFNLTGTLIGLSFLIATILLRDKHGFGHWPWIFWVGLAFGLSTNFTLYIPRLMYVKGIERLEKKNQV